MASSYPTGLDAFPTTRPGGNLVGPDVLDHADALNKIEAELGVNPSSSYTDVAARLAAIEAAEGGGGGGGVSSSLEAKLTNSPAAGTNSLTLDRTAPAGWVAQSFIVVDAYTPQAELVKMNSASGTSVVTVASLKYSHAAGDTVLLLNSGVATAALWGVKADGSTDDHDALQEAIVQCAANGIWLDCQAKTSIIASPLVLPQSHKIRNFNFKASASFAPADTNNAALMTQDGNIVSVVSADPATDIITTNVAHGIPADGIGVVFGGSSLPAGLVAGRFYYAYNRTTTTFTVSATVGGPNVDITATGTGTAYCEVYSANIKSFFQNGFLNCNLVPGLNGILVSVQQNAQWDVFRVDGAPGFGIRVTGQEAGWQNIEVNNCGVGIQFDNMSFLYAYEISMQGCTTSFLQGINAGLISSSLTGIHIEDLDAPGTYIDFATGPCSNVLLDDVTISGMGTDSASNVGIDLGVAGTKICTYEIRRLKFPTASVGTSNLAVRDNYRGKSILAYTASSTASADREIGCLIGNNVPSAGTISDSYVGTTVWGVGGKEMRFGQQQNISPLLELSPGSSQTADSLIVRDTTGAQKLGITKDAALWLAKLLVGSNAGPQVLSGTGSPEGAVTAPVGSLFLRTDGGTNTTVYRKEAGAGNTGWVASASGGGGGGDPANMVKPGDMGLLAWTAPWWLGVNSPGGIGAGTQEVWAMRFVMPASGTVTNVVGRCATAGVSFSGNGAKFAIFDNAGSTRLFVSGDLSASLGATGAKTLPFATPGTLAAGVYWLAFWAQATTMPRFDGQSLALTPGISAVNQVVSRVATGLTDMPATITPNVAGGAQQPWTLGLT